MEPSTEEKEMRQEPKSQLLVRHDVPPPAGLLNVSPGFAAALEGGRVLDSAFDLSHELRTSLAVVTLVSGNLDRLYERLDDGQRRKMIRDIRQHMRKLNNVIGDLLTLPSDCDPRST